MQNCKHKISVTACFVKRENELRESPTEGANIARLICTHPRGPVMLNTTNCLYIILRIIIHIHIYSFWSWGKKMFYNVYRLYWPLSATVVQLHFAY